MAHVVTIMFHIIHHTTKGAVEGRERPAWLSLSVHVFNAALVWADLIIAQPRTFSARSQKLSGVVVGSYCCWLFVQKLVRGEYPYPFMNKMPHPKGFLYMISSGTTLFLLMFKMGRWVNGKLQRLLGKPGKQVSSKVYISADARAKAE
jgi:hypothetical protein